MCSINYYDDEHAADQNTVAPFLLEGGALEAGTLPVGLLCGGPRETGWEGGGAGAVVLLRCFSTMI